MSDARFDILFAGETLPGANPAEVRRRVQALFKVSDEAAERLFSGKPIAVKRAVDAETSRRYDALFRDAGALVRIAPVPAENQPGRPVPPAGPHTPEPASIGSGDSQLGLAPESDTPLEPPVSAAPPPIDLSHLSLVEGDWSLSDCAPPPPPLAVPDIEHLGLVPTEGETGRGS
ncbi:MAG: hypothetical protein MUC77_11950 [Chromatiaceae bacterium]|jgi:hypothetical protein|nr:hypothetical protein [Chromatiaceae bacterium]